MNNERTDYKSIPGWNTDADQDNEPTYPIKHYTGDDHQRTNWQRPTQQRVSVELLKSIERPTPSAVFGTPQPPSGLSGKLRRKAFKFTESEYGHWLNLLLADRINVVEGFIDDFKRGHIPNIFAEKGWAADWKHNPRAIIRKVLIATVVTAAIVTVANMKKKRRSLLG